MRRVLILAVAAVVFTLPWAVGDRPSAEPAAAAGTVPTQPTATPVNTLTASGAPVIAGAPAAPEASAVIAPPAPTEAAEPATIPSIAADTQTSPPGEDYWTFASAGLPEDFASTAIEIEGVVAAYPYTAGTMHLVASHRSDGSVVDEVTPGWFIPIDGAIVAPEHIELYLGAETGLGPDQVVLGRSSAELRGLGVGDTMTFESGATLTVGAVIEDRTFGESEMIALTTVPFEPDRFKTRAAIVRFDGDEEDLRVGLETVFGTDATFGLLPRYEHADNGPRIVRSWVFMKQTFGEFEYRPGRGVAVEIEPAWREANIVEVNLPLLGVTKCHVRYAETLTAVMNRLIEEGKGDIITRRTFFGCWNPRYIRGTTRLSRHSFGIAADINFSGRTGDQRGSPVHSALLATMTEFGVHSGHVWVTPDAGHFEFYGFPEGHPPKPSAR